MSDLDWLKNLYVYWKTHETPRHKLMYPTHKTEADKRLLRAKRAKAKRLAMKKG